MSSLMEAVLLFLPRLGLAAVLLGVGLVAALILQAVFRKFFSLIGIDGLAEKIGIDGYLKSAGARQPLSRTFARMIFWFVLVFILVPVSDVLGMTMFGELVNRAILFIPNIFAALLVLLAGAWAAKFLGGIVRGSAKGFGGQYAGTLGTVSSVTVLLIAFIIALAQLGIDSSLLSSVLLIVVGAIALGTAVAFGIGAKDILRNAIAGIYVSRSYEAGTTVLVGEREGKLEEIGTLVSTVAFGREKSVTVPNSALLDSR